MGEKGLLRLYALADNGAGYEAVRVLRTPENESVVPPVE
jgi:hypothetical protein